MTKYPPFKHNAITHIMTKDEGYSKYATRDAESDIGRFKTITRKDTLRHRPQCQPL